MGGMSRTDDGLRWDATDIEAITAHELSFDQCHLCAHACGACGSDEPGGTGAHNNQIVSPIGCGVLPLRRVDIFRQQSVVLVVRLKVQLRVNHQWLPLVRSVNLG